jgi:hypothetical protein
MRLALKNNLVVIISVLLFLNLVSCQNSEEKIPDVSHIKVDFKLHRAEQKLINADSLREIQEYLAENSDFTKAFHYPNPNILSKALFKLSKDPYMDTLSQICTDVYQNEVLEADFRDAFRRIKYYYPEFEAPDIYTMVTGFQYDLIVEDKVALVGLDFYLGNAHSHYRPDVRELPEYIWRRYDVSTLVPNTVRFMSSNFIAQDVKDKTMLNQMIAYGKVYHFMEKVLPNVPDSVIIGYTGQEMYNAEGNLNFIWGHFVENGVFFDQSKQAENRYLKEAPFVNVISQKCPGRIGRWLGWQIVRAYMQEHSEVTLTQLMQDKDAQKIFQQSHFKPQRTSP